MESDSSIDQETNYYENIAPKGQSFQSTEHRLRLELQHSRETLKDVNKMFLLEKKARRTAQKQLEIYVDQNQQKRLRHEKKYAIMKRKLQSLQRDNEALRNEIKRLVRENQVERFAMPQREGTEESLTFKEYQL